MSFLDSLPHTAKPSRHSLYSHSLLQPLLLEQHIAESFGFLYKLPQETAFLNCFCFCIIQVLDFPVSKINSLAVSHHAAASVSPTLGACYDSILLSLGKLILLLAFFRARAEPKASHLLSNGLHPNSFVWISIGQATLTKTPQMFKGPLLQKFSLCLHMADCGLMGSKTWKPRFCTSDAVTILLPRSPQQWKEDMRKNTRYYLIESRDKSHCWPWEHLPHTPCVGKCMRWLVSLGARTLCSSNWP